MCNIFTHTQTFMLVLKNIVYFLDYTKRIAIITLRKVISYVKLYYVYYLFCVKTNHLQITYEMFHTTQHWHTKTIEKLSKNAFFFWRELYINASECILRSSAASTIVFYRECRCRMTHKPYKLLWPSQERVKWISRTTGILIFSHPAFQLHTNQRTHTSNFFHFHQRNALTCTFFCIRVLGMLSTQWTNTYSGRNELFFICTHKLPWTWTPLVACLCCSLHSHTVQYTFHFHYYAVLCWNTITMMTQLITTTNTMDSHFISSFFFS